MHQASRDPSSSDPPDSTDSVPGAERSDGSEHSAEETRLLVQRLKRAEGQLAAIRRMVEDDQPCVDVLLQIAAVRGALGKVGQLLLRTHVQTCVTDALRSGDESARAEQVDELIDVFARFGGIHGR